MTENEAKEMLQAKLTCIGLENLACIEKGCSRDCDSCKYNYTQGTRGEQEEAIKIAVGIFEKIQQYRSIGTIEDCKEAMKRQQVMKPKEKVQNEDLKIGCVTFKVGTKTYWCPHCEKAITGSDHYCRWCGQAISWEKD